MLKILILCMSFAIFANPEGVLNVAIDGKQRQAIVVFLSKQKKGLLVNATKDQVKNHSCKIVPEGEEKEYILNTKRSFGQFVIYDLIAGLNLPTTFALRSLESNAFKDLPSTVEILRRFGLIDLEGLSINNDGVKYHSGQPGFLILHGVCFGFIEEIKTSVSFFQGKDNYFVRPFYKSSLQNDKVDLIANSEALLKALHNMSKENTTFEAALSNYEHALQEGKLNKATAAKFMNDIESASDSEIDVNIETATAAKENKRRVLLEEKKKLALVQLQYIMNCSEIMPTEPQASASAVSADQQLVIDAYLAELKQQKDVLEQKEADRKILLASINDFRRQINDLTLQSAQEKQRIVQLTAENNKLILESNGLRALFSNVDKEKETTANSHKRAIAEQQSSFKKQLAAMQALLDNEKKKLIDSEANYTNEIKALKASYEVQLAQEKEALAKANAALVMKDKAIANFQMLFRITGKEPEKDNVVADAVRNVETLEAEGREKIAKKQEFVHKKILKLLKNGSNKIDLLELQKLLGGVFSKSTCSRSATPASERSDSESSTNK